MDIDLKLKGYRCFSPDSPAKIEFRGDVMALVGINNSGKSTLLKALYELRPIFLALTQKEDYRRFAIMSDAGLELPTELGDPAEIFWHFGNADIEIGIKLPGLRPTTGVAANPQLDILISRERQRISVNLYDLNGRPTPKFGAWQVGPGFQVSKEGYELGSFDEIMAALQILAHCFYYPSVRHVTAFKPDTTSNAKYYDVYTGKPFIDQWATRATGSGKLSTEKIDSMIEDLRRIFRFDRLSIQADGSRRELLVIANGKSSRLSELGTGLAQFILLLGNIAFAEPSYLLIDEPENNLHPSLQLEFVNVMAARASQGVIFATHNLGLARQAADRILAFSPSSQGCTVSAFHKTDNLAQIIGELSFGRSDFAPARKLLLVEGQTDVLTMQNLLAIFGNEHHFAIISLGGKDGIHPRRQGELEQMLALAIDVVAIIDSERASASDRLSSDRKGFAAMCQRLNIRCHVLERRATENYFTQRAIDQALGLGRFKALGHHESLSSVRAQWPKKSNWRIARELLRSEIEATDMGQFLSSL